MTTLVATGIPDVSPWPYLQIIAQCDRSERIFLDQSFHEQGHEVRLKPAKDCCWYVKLNSLPLGLILPSTPGLCQLAMAPAIKSVDHKSHRQPDYEPKPGLERERDH